MLNVIWSHMSYHMYIVQVRILIINHVIIFGHLHGYILWSTYLDSYQSISCIYYDQFDWSLWLSPRCPWAMASRRLDSFTPTRLDTTRCKSRKIWVLERLHTPWRLQVFRVFLVNIVSGAQVGRLWWLWFAVPRWWWTLVWLLKRGTFNCICCRVCIMYYVLCIMYYVLCFFLVSLLSSPGNARLSKPSWLLSAGKHPFQLTDFVV